MEVPGDPLAASEPYIGRGLLERACEHQEEREEDANDDNNDDDDDRKSSFIAAHTRAKKKWEDMIFEENKT